jgi:sugar phosphate isomerase/epimerase
MILPGPERFRLTYCTNIHPGNSLAEVIGNIDRRVAAVKKLVSPDAPFGVGLWLSHAAAHELTERDNLPRFKNFLAERDLYVFTLNGFPYGAFHGERIKERVYLPDWRDEARLEYTITLARLLADLLPGDEPEGSISTLPLAYKADIRSERDIESTAAMLIRCASAMHEILDRTGKTISVNLEPEPLCALETAAETAEFFRDRLFPSAAREEIVRRHIGVCIDACHMAVEYEQPSALLKTLSDAGVRVGKMQISSALKIPHLTASALDALLPFAEGTYLHQVVERCPGGIRRFADLSEAIASANGGEEEKEWRIHYHIPICRPAPEPFGDTRDFLIELLDIARAQPFTRHFEVETYTWEVLPHSLRGQSVEEDIAREIEWAAKRISA